MILAYIFIILLIGAIVLLWKEVKNLKKSQITLKENDKGEVILSYKKQELVNYKIEKK